MQIFIKTTFYIYISFAKPCFYFGAQLLENDNFQNVSYLVATDKW